VNDLTSASKRVSDYRKGNEEISAKEFPNKDLDIKDEKCK